MDEIKLFLKRNKKRVESINKKHLALLKKQTGIQKSSNKLKHCKNSLYLSKLSEKKIMAVVGTNAHLKKQIFETNELIKELSKQVMDLNDHIKKLETKPIKNNHPLLISNPFLVH